MNVYKTVTLFSLWMLTLNSYAQSTLDWKKIKCPELSEAYGVEAFKLVASGYYSNKGSKCLKQSSFNLYDLRSIDEGDTDKKIKVIAKDYKIKVLKTTPGDIGDAKFDLEIQESKKTHKISIDIMLRGNEEISAGVYSDQACATISSVSDESFLDTSCK